MNTCLEPTPPTTVSKPMRVLKASGPTLRLHWVRNHNRPHRLRRVVQLTFLGICLWIGWRFFQFYHSCLDVNGAIATRPAGVEAFLPISALISAKLWFKTGIIQPVHPAGLLIFAAVVAVSFLFRRSFCSWVCPVGLLSEKLGDSGSKLLKRNWGLPRWVDVPLRGIKYLLLGFFAYVIFCRMDLDSLRAFLDSPFNHIADVRLLQFFRYASPTTMVVLVVLAVLSVLVRNFWCRYACPYGALTAMAGLLSPVRIKRDIPSCIDCGKCSKACPALLPVHKLVAVRSEECSLCLECVEACPVADTLSVNLVATRRRVKPLFLALAIGGIFLFMDLYGRWSGHWQSSVSPEQLKQEIQYFAQPRP